MRGLLEFWRDSRQGLRRLSQNPTFALVAVLTLAVGIGMNATVFSLFDGLVLHPHDFDTTGLVAITPVFSNGGAGRYLSAPEYDAIRSRATSFQSVATHDIGNWNLTGTPTPERLIRALITPNVFETYGVAPMIGREFLPEETTGDSNVRSVIISHRLWRSHFGQIANFVGRSIELNGSPYEVVGILPPNFVLGILGLGEADLYTPWVTEFDRLARGQRELQVVGRLRPGVSIEEAHAEVQAIAAQLEQEHGSTTPEYNAWTLRAIPLDDAGDARTRTIFVLLLLAVAVILMIACVNVANLVLTRAVSRQKEVALRAALGATRARLGRQFLAEGLVLSTTGGLLGVWFAYWGLQLILPLLPIQFVPPGATVSLNVPVLAFVTALVTMAAIAFGLAPVWSRSVSMTSSVLQESSNRILGGSRSRRLTSSLVVVEVALSVVLLTVTTLVVRSYDNILKMDAGFDPDNVLIMRLTLPIDKYTRPQIPEFFRTAEQRIAALPGIMAVGVSSTVPPLGLGMATFVSESDDTATPIRAGATVASAGFFETLRIPVHRGRLFEPADGSPGTPLVAVINEQFAAEMFPDSDPLGQRLRLANTEAQWATIVGVVGTMRSLGSEVPTTAEVFTPAAREEGSWNQLFFTVRTEAPMNSIVAGIRSEIRSLDPQLALYRIGPLNEEIRISRFRWQAAAWVFSIFSFVAGFLATVGLYAIVSDSVTQRVQELGVRMALGASRHEIRRTVVMQGLRLGLLGIAIGTAVALVSTRFMSALLFQVAPTDAQSLVFTGMTLLATVLVASYIPARRATRVNPAVALRNE